MIYVKGRNLILCVCVCGWACLYVEQHDPSKGKPSSWTRCYWNPSLLIMQIHTHTHTRAGCKWSFFPRSMGKQLTCVFFSLHDSLLSGEPLLRQVTFLSGRLREWWLTGANAPQWTRVLFLATVGAAQDISQTFGRVRTTETSFSLCVLVVKTKKKW